MRYAFFNAQGRVEIACNDDTIDQLPAGAVELTQEQWNDRFNLRLQDGELINDPIVPEVEVPQRVTMRQARLALLQAGLLDNVAAAIEGMPSPQKEAAQIEWEYSQEVHRDKALVLALAPALGLDDAALDQLFITAAAL
ncbi:MAG TPA: hypothetical protein VFS17_03195 [Methylophilaceae bacterium]|nr:hypothetical protein [Methylophilaceae bacterium]